MQIHPVLLACAALGLVFTAGAQGPNGARGLDRAPGIGPDVRSYGNAPSASTFCTSKASSMFGCIPTFQAAKFSVSKSIGSFDCTAGPVPAGDSTPCLLLVSTSSLLGSPLQSSFGWLCMDQPRRLSQRPAFAGGTSGTCTGLYTFELQEAVATSQWILAGDTLYVQAWYRDNGFAP